MTVIMGSFLFLSTKKYLEKQNINFTHDASQEMPVKGPVKLIKRVKIAHSFLQSVSDQFHVSILSLPM